MNDDLISRQDAIDAILEDKISDDSLKIMIALGDEENAKTLNMTCDRHVKMLMNLPSAEPERKTGKWITIPCGLLFYRTYVCSECGCKITCGDAYKFCPDCGARMEEENERSD